MRYPTPLFSESLADYLARAPKTVTRAMWSEALDAAYADWKARPFRWMDGKWHATPEPARDAPPAGST